MNIGREQRQQITYNSGEQQKRRAETDERTNNDVEAWHKVIMIPYLTSINRFAVWLYRNITKANLLFMPLPSDRGHSSAGLMVFADFSRQSDTPVYSTVITKSTSCSRIRDLHSLSAIMTASWLTIWKPSRPAVSINFHADNFLTQLWCRISANTYQSILKFFIMQIANRHIFAGFSMWDLILHMQMKRCQKSLWAVSLKINSINSVLTFKMSKKDEIQLMQNPRIVSYLFRRRTFQQTIIE